MGTSQADKHRTRARILDEAAQRFRRDGLSGASVAGVMQGAGLTHGGFYKHFTDRDQLVREALQHALVVDADPTRYGSFEQFVRQYVSRSHRDDPGHGCPIGAVASEVAHADAATRSAITSGVRDAIDRLTTLTGDDAAGAAAFAAAVGAIVLARAVDDAALSDRILAATRRTLRALPGPENPS